MTCLSHGKWILTIDDKELLLPGESFFIGSDPLCEITLFDTGIASFHAEFTPGEEGYLFNCEDLGTSILVNDEEMVRGEIRSGDIVLFGKTRVIFTEKPFVLNQIPQFASFENFEDIETTKDQFAIAETVKTKRIEVINYHNGHIQDVSYIPLKHGDYFIGRDKVGKNHIPFETIDHSTLFTIEHRALKFHPHPELVPSRDWGSLSLGETIFLTKGAEQVSLRIVHQSVEWKSLPLSFERDFWKSALTVGLFLFLPFFALQFIELPKQDPPKPHVVVIYKVKETPSEVEKNAPSEMPSEAVAEASAPPEIEQAPEVKEVAPPKTQPEKIAEVRPAPTPKIIPKPVVKPIPQKASVPVEVALAPGPIKEPVKKAYTFNTGLAKSLVGSAKDVKLDVAQSKVAATTPSFKMAPASDKSLVGTSRGPAKLSADSSGTNFNSGSRGIASKSGFDTSSIDKNTVIRGSMDPEVLRKILREYIPQFRHCYQQELIYKSEKIKGILDLDFTINAEGKASRYTVRAKDAQFSKRGIDCMGNVLAIIDFPKPKGGGIVDVTQPLNFFAEK